jgi:hypothetical protein
LTGEGFWLGKQTIPTVPAAQLEAAVMTSAWLLYNETGVQLPTKNESRDASSAQSAVRVDENGVLVMAHAPRAGLVGNRF